MTTSMRQPHLSKMRRGKGPKTAKQRRDLQRRRMAEEGLEVPPLNKRRRKKAA